MLSKSLWITRGWYSSDPQRAKHITKKPHSTAAKAVIRMDTTGTVTKYKSCTELDKAMSWPIGTASRVACNGGWYSDGSCVYKPSESPPPKKEPTLIKVRVTDLIEKIVHPSMTLRQVMALTNVTMACVRKASSYNYTIKKRWKVTRLQ